MDWSVLEEQTGEASQTTTPRSLDLPRIHSLTLNHLANGEARQERTIDLREGENWLKLKVTAESEESNRPYVEILRLKDEETQYPPTKDCYLSLLVDGSFLAIMDMRWPRSKGNDNDDEKTWELCLVRRGQTVSFRAGSFGLEPLPRRHMRIVHEKDRICLVSPAGTVQLFLEYRYEAAIETKPARHDGEAATTPSQIHAGSQIAESPGAPKLDAVQRSPRLSPSRESDGGIVAGSPERSIDANETQSPMKDIVRESTHDTRKPSGNEFASPRPPSEYDATTASQPSGQIQPEERMDKPDTSEVAVEKEPLTEPSTEVPTILGTASGLLTQPNEDDDDASSDESTVDPNATEESEQRNESGSLKTKSTEMETLVATTTREAVSNPGTAVTELVPPPPPPLQSQRTESTEYVTAPQSPVDHGAERSVVETKAAASPVVSEGLKIANILPSPSTGDAAKVAATEKDEQNNKYDLATEDVPMEQSEEKLEKAQKAPESDVVNEPVPQQPQREEEREKELEMTEKAPEPDASGEPAPQPQLEQRPIDSDITSVGNEKLKQDNIIMDAPQREEREKELEDSEKASNEQSKQEDTTMSDTHPEERAKESEDMGKTPEADTGREPEPDPEQEQQLVDSDITPKRNEQSKQDDIVMDDMHCEEREKEPETAEIVPAVDASSEPLTQPGQEQPPVDSSDSRSERKETSREDDTAMDDTILDEKKAPEEDAVTEQLPQNEPKQGDTSMEDTQLEECANAADTKSLSSPKGAVTAVSGPSTPVAAKPVEPTSARNTRSSRKRKMDSTRDEASGEADGPTHSARKRSRRTAREKADDSDEQVVKVMTTAVKLTQVQKNMVKKIDGILLEDVADAHTATHVIASDGKTSIRRTPKLMIALCRTPNIVSLDWLKKSASRQEALPCDEFLVLDDREAEEQYKFSMRETLERIKSNVKNGSYLLDGWHIYVCAGVAGKKAPPEEELRLITEAAGGSWISSPSSITASPDHVLIVTSDPETKRQVSTKAVTSLLKKGASKRTTSWLFRAMMTQEVDL